MSDTPDPRAHDALIERLTDKLSVDAELQLDVQQELRAHLADSEADFLAAGDDPETASANAARALGEADELAEELWQANRRRMSIRSIIRWLLRLTLIPAAAAVILLIIFGMQGKLSMPDYTEEQRLLVGEGMFNGGPCELDSARRLHELKPDDPIYLANYAVVRNTNTNVNDPAARQEWLAFLEEARQIDPDSGMYDLMEAWALIESSVELDEEAAATIDVPDPREESGTATLTLQKATITDEAAFQQALVAARESLSKPASTQYMPDMLARIDLTMGQPRRMTEMLRQTAVDVSFLLPNVSGQRRLVKAICWRAYELAQAGELQQAEELLGLARGLSLRMGAQADTLIEVLVAHACMLYTHTTEIIIGEATNQPEMTAEGRRGFIEGRNLFRKSRRTLEITPDEIAGMGLFWSILAPASLDTSSLDFEPLRNAEKAMAAQLGLVWLLEVLLVIALFQGLLVLISLIRQQKPLLVWVGWRRIGRICLWSIVVPMVGYLFYAHVLTSERNRYGLNFIAAAVVVEYLLLGVIIVAMFMIQTRRAIRDRAEELGLCVPPKATLRNRKVLCGLALLVSLPCVAWLAWYWIAGPVNLSMEGLVYFLLGGFRQLMYYEDPPGMLGLLLLVAIPVGLLIWAVAEAWRLYRHKEHAPFRRSLRRSRVGILAAAVIVVGICFGAVLARSENQAMARVKGDADFGLARELERSSLRALKHRMAEDYEQWRAGSKEE